MAKKIKKSKFKEGDRCAICDKQYKVGGRFARHHVDYNKDITITTCYVCHSLLHGTAKVWRHPLGDYGRDRQPYEFAKRLIKAYNKALKEKK